MATRRKIRDAQDARHCLAAAKASGQSRSEWARQHGVDGRSLYSWTKRVAPDEAGIGEKRRGMVELVAKSHPAESRYVVQCGQFAVEIDEHFDDVTLGRLLKVVAAC